jgi:lauroyl/myristoyl acyltransferase
VASAFGTLRSWGYRPVSPEDLAGLLGETRQRRHDLLVRGLARNHYLDSFLFRLRRRHGIQPLIRVLDISGAEQLEALHRQQQPVILILSHMGPPSGVVAALCHTGLPVLCMAALPLKHSVSDNLRVLAVRSSDADRTVALKSALSELRNGGIVLITVDGMTGKTAREYAILGHRQHLQRGISVLQRLGKATVMPVSTSWRRLGRVEVAFEAPLVETSETDSEEAVQELLVSWFESHIRDHADQIRADRLRVWLDDANPPAAR